MPGSPIDFRNMDAIRQMDSQMLERSIISRSIWETGVRKDRIAFEHVRWLNERGAEVRTVPQLPCRMIISDRRTAILQSDPDDVRAGISIYHELGAVEAFQALFDSIWSQAVVWGNRIATARHELSDSDLAMLELLAVGNRYAVIAKSLDVDESTIRRRLKVLMVELDARTPFEAAYRAIKKGWL